MNLLRWASLAGFLFLFWECAKGFRGYQTERNYFRTDYGRVLPPPDFADLGMTGVSFAARDGTVIRGWYIPSRTGAAVVLCHGSAGTRKGALEEARVLAETGDGLLLFDMPGRGESGGVVKFGAPERAAVEGALDFLGARPDVRDGRIGGLGFSTGAYVLTQVASFDHRLKAVVLEGAFGDPLEQTRAAYTGRPFGTRLGAVLSVRMHMDVKQLRPIDVIAKIAPRPLVIVAGAKDLTVPPQLSRELYEAAKVPKQLWIIEGAGHGQYASVDTTYAPRLRAFFRQSLGIADNRGAASAKSPASIISSAPSNP